MPISAFHQKYVGSKNSRTILSKENVVVRFREYRLVTQNLQKKLKINVKTSFTFIFKTMSFLDDF